MPFTFSNSYARLPDRFYARLAPDTAPAPGLIRLNAELAVSLGLDPSALASPSGIATLAGGPLPDGAEPLAMAYAGHQFGNWVPQLGDGRAILLGEILAPDGARYDLHLKGAGRTPYSRGGDGKAVLGAALREYILSEAMAALGIPTTRALAVVTTGESVWRETAEPGAVLARIAASHIRVGTFQYFYARRDTEALQALLDHVIARHYPQAKTAESPALALLDAVMHRQADLVARWMQVGFIHGVMNTDNMSIAGETIDYGPCAFLDGYHPGKVFSSIDRQGRYAFGNQPQIAHWNLAQLAQSLLPLLPDPAEHAAAQAQAVLDGFGPVFEQAYFTRFCAKIGLPGSNALDRSLIDDLLAAMAATEVDFTLGFSTLTTGLTENNFDAFRALFPPSADINTWLTRWQARLQADALDRMQSANPVYIPRNHQVENAIQAAYTGDLTPFETLIKTLSHPYARQAGLECYESPPNPDEVVHATFCGT